MSTFKQIEDKKVATSSETWSDLRVLYESGEYPSLNALYECNKDKYPDMPRKWDLETRCGEECWDKYRLQEVRTEVKRRNMVELYASLGMDDEEQARYRIKCVKAVDEIREVIGELYHKLTELDPNSQFYNETLSKIKVLTDTMFKGMGTSLAALQDISKLTGSYAPVSTKEIKANSYKSSDGITSIEDMTEEEIIQDLKRMHAAGITLQEIEGLNFNTEGEKRGNEP